MAWLAAVLVVVVGALLVVIQLGAQVMASTRAYVTAEGHYIKGQKDAVRALERYMRTGDERHFHTYQRRVAVPLADRRAREALQSDPPDNARAATAFVDALNHPEDAEAMVTLFPYSTVIEEMAHAIEIWEAGDAEVAELVALAEHVHRRRLAGAQAEEFEAEYTQLDELSARLDQLGVEFSASLTAGSRRIRALVQWSVLASALLLLLVSVGVVARRTARARDRDDALRAMINHGHDLLALLSADGRFLYANGSLERTFGWSASAHPNLTLRQFAGATSQQAVDELLKRGHASTGNVSECLEIQHPDGVARKVELTLSQLPVESSSGLLLLTARDVTEQRAMQAKAIAAQRMQSVGRLAGGIAHDFNNMLTAILASAELGKRQVEVDAPARQHFRTIIGASRRSATLVSRLLQFASERPMLVQPLSWRDRILEAEPLVRRMVDERVQLVFSLPNSPVVVRGNPTQLEQLLLNLVSNARDALTDGKGTIRITLAVEQEAGDGGEASEAGGPGWAELRVEDDGAGIEPAIVDRIFDPFFTTKGPTEGTGLGLASCHGIVRQHEGQLEVESSLGQGSRFTARLPLQSETQLGDEESSARTSSPDSHVRGTQRKETILYIEDEEAVRRSGTAILESFGYEVLEAATGEEAFALSRERAAAISLVLSDVVLPRMQGVDILAAIRARDPDMPFLFVSGYHESPALRLQLGGKRVAFLSKPYTMDQLHDAIETLLGESLARPVDAKELA